MIIIGISIHYFIPITPSLFEVTGITQIATLKILNVFKLIFKKIIFI